MAFPGLTPRASTGLVVLHWTAGRGDSSQVFRTLRADGLSVHFCIDVDGSITQYADAGMMCSHASGMNARAVGIEIVNPATPDVAGPPKRTVLRERINGRDVIYSAFLPAQVRSAIDLTTALCVAYRLPIAAPTIAGDVIPRQLTPTELAAHRGFCGHFHWSPVKRKSDPGLALLRAIIAEPGRLSQAPEAPEPAAE